MIQVDTERKSLSYLGEGNLERRKIKESIEMHERAVVWGRPLVPSIKVEYSFHDLIHTALEGLNSTMYWRKRFAFRKQSDPIRHILGDRSIDFYSVFDSLRKERISIVAAGSRTNHPFLSFLDRRNFVAGIADRDAQAIFYGHGLLETWRADPRTLQFDGKGAPSFQTLFRISIVSLITQYLGIGLSTSRKIRDILDPQGILDTNLRELVQQKEDNTWPGTEEVQRKAAIALRGYLNAWFDFMTKSGWLEIHHTLQDSKIAEKEQSFLDTATTEISETAREIIVDVASEEAFDTAQRERKERERREKHMEWTMMRIALGILYPREKDILRALWEKTKRGLTWKKLEETYYEEIWDLIRLHLAGRDMNAEIEEKDRHTLGRMHFIFELKRSERPKEKVRTLEQLSIVELIARKEYLLSRLQWEGRGLPSDSPWRDIVYRFRKLIIRYHPDRIEVTGIEASEAQMVSSQVIQDFRELEIIHDLHSEVFK
ncbi:MAG: hypothetical protein ACE5KA_01885 [Nitrososphaerales archaeon]